MHRDRIEGFALRLRGYGRELWGRLIASQTDISVGWREQVAGQAQALYGLAQDLAARSESRKLVGQAAHED